MNFDRATVILFLALVLAHVLWLLLPGAAQAQQVCPEDWPDGCPCHTKPGDTTMHLPANCPAPFQGELVPTPTWRKIHQDATDAGGLILQLDAEIDGLEEDKRRLVKVGARLKTKIREVQHHNDVLQEKIREFREEGGCPDTVRVWPWAGLGSLGVGLGVAGGFVLGAEDEEYVLAGAVGGASILGIALLRDFLAWRTR